MKAHELHVRINRVVMHTTDAACNGLDVEALAESIRVELEGATIPALEAGRNARADRVNRGAGPPGLGHHIADAVAQRLELVRGLQWGDRSGAGP